MGTLRPWERCLPNLDRYRTIPRGTSAGAILTASFSHAPPTAHQVSARFKTSATQQWFAPGTAAVNRAGGCSGAWQFLRSDGRLLRLGLRCLLLVAWIMRGLRPRQPWRFDKHPRHHLLPPRPCALGLKSPSFTLTVCNRTRECPRHTECLLLDITPHGTMTSKASWTWLSSYLWTSTWNLKEHRFGH